MKKMNKKGFTLIEMLVVIAIIAILVAIIIPTVMNATDKSKAATDAANLRSAKAVITTGMLGSSENYAKPETGSKTVTDAALADSKVPANSKYNPDDAFNASIAADGTVSVYYGNHALEYYASIADGKTPVTTYDKTSGGSGSGEGGTQGVLS